MSDTLKAYQSRNVPRYTSYPTAPHLSKDFNAKSYADWLISLPAHEPISLYLHVPFCRELCWYCGCNMKLAKRDEPVAAYAKTLVKEVELLAQHLLILSSLAEVMLKRERKAIADLFAMEKPAIEVNNAAGLHAFGDRPHRIGPFMNAYNEATIAWMARQGVGDLGLAIEVQVFGRASLAVSARSYHARAHGRTKDNCQFVCEDDGMPLCTTKNQPILRVNGIQTQSESYVDLSAETTELIANGISHLPLMPQTVDMVAVAQVFRDALDNKLEPEALSASLLKICGDTAFSNRFYRGQVGYRRIAMAASG